MWKIRPEKVLESFVQCYTESGKQEFVPTKIGFQVHKLSHYDITSLVTMIYCYFLTHFLKILLFFFPMLSGIFDQFSSSIYLILYRKVSIPPQATSSDPVQILNIGLPWWRSG